MGRADAGGHERPAPAVGVEHRQRVQVDVAVADPGVQAEGDRVGPDVAVGDLHPLGSCRGPRRVVDRRGRALVVLPGLRLDALGVHVRVVADGEHVLAGDVLEDLGQLGVDVEHPRARVLDDVADLLDGEPEVDRHQHPPVTRDPEERGEQACAVVRDVGDPVAEPDPELVQLGGLRPGQLAHPGVGELAERARRLLRLVHDAGALGVDGQRAVEEVVDGERHDHGCDLLHSADGSTLASLARAGATLDDDLRDGDGDRPRAARPARPVPRHARVLGRRAAQRRGQQGVRRLVRAGPRVDARAPRPRGDRRGALRAQPPPHPARPGRGGGGLRGQLHRRPREPPRVGGDLPAPRAPTGPTGPRARCSGCSPRSSTSPGWCGPASRWRRPSGSPTSAAGRPGRPSRGRR